MRRVYGLDPSRELQEIARRRAARLPLRIEFLAQTAEATIPLRSESIDTVVLTWTLCSIEDFHTALNEIGRVMEPSARLIFIEHGCAPDRAIKLWQDRLTPLWKRVAGGCHLNRQVNTVLEQAGYELFELKRGYLPGPRPMTYTYRGVAVRRR